MKRLFSTSFNQNGLHIVLLLLRLLVAALMLTHGWPKLEKLITGGEIEFGDPLGIGSYWSLALTVFAEFFCSLFILIGLGTRLAAIPLLITMLTVAFVVHADDALGDKELPLLYAAIFLLLMVSGGGKYSIDHSFGRKFRR